MRTGRLWIGAGLGMALLLSINVNGARAQTPENLPMPTGPRTGVPANGVPANGGAPIVRHETVGQPGMEEHHGEGGHGGEVEDEHEAEGGLYVIADYLYLRARRRAFDFAITDPFLNGAVQGTVSSLSWTNNSGYRVGGGYRLGHGWEAGVSYFYFHTNDNRTAFAPTGGALFATLTAPGIDQVSNAFATTNLNMDVIDAEVAKRIESDGLTLRLSGGVRVAEISQKLGAAYSGATAGAGVVSVSSPINFTGIGVRVGAEGWWDAWCTGYGKLGLYAKGYGSLLSGEFHSRLLQVANNGATPIVDVSDKFDKVVPVAEVGIGIGWQNERMQFRVGYELMNYFNLIDSVDFVDSNSFGKIGHRIGDLSLEGLVVSLGLFF
jgi:hypothetical protein